MSLKIKSIKESPLNYLKTFKIVYEDKTGRDKVWELTSRGDKARLEKEIQGQEFSDGSMMVAWNETKTSLVMIKEFRIAAGHYVYSFPAGLQDEGEDILEASIREFKEETGMDFKPLGLDRPRYTSVGLTNEKVYTVFGRYSGNFSKEYLEDSEDISPLLVDRKKAIELLQNEDVTIRSAFILRAFFQLPLYEEI